MRKSEGRAVIWTPIIYLLVCLVLYIIITYAPPYITYYKINQAFTTVVMESSHLNDQDFQGELYHRLESVEIPFPLQDIAVTRVGDTVILDVLYTVTIELPMLAPRTLTFNPHAEGNVSNSTLE